MRRATLLIFSKFFAVTNKTQLYFIRIKLEKIQISVL